MDRNLGDDIANGLIYLHRADMSQREISGDSVMGHRCQEVYPSSSMEGSTHQRRLTAILIATLPVEVEELILRRTDARMRLVVKATASLSHLIPGSPSHPFKFLTIICGGKASEWLKLVFACTGAFEQVSANIHGFFNKYSHESFELEKIYTEMCSNPTIAYDGAIRYKIAKLEAKPVPDTVQSCLLASLVFETGSFGMECDRTVKGILFAIARLYFQDKVRELKEACDEHLHNDICALLKDSRVPWYWTLVFYGDLSESTEIRSIRRIFHADESRELITNLVLKVDPNDHYLVRMIYQRLNEMQSSVKSVDEIGEFAKLIFTRFCEHIGVDQNTDSKNAAILSVPERLELYYDGCYTDTPNQFNCPKAAGPLYADLLMKLLRAFYDDHDNDAECEKGSKLDKKECLKRFGAVLSVIDHTVPIMKIIHYLESRDEEQLFTENGNESLGCLIRALTYSPYLAIPKFVIRFFSFHKLQNLFDSLLRLSCRKGASHQVISHFASQTVMVFKVPFPAVIMSRRLSPPNYMEGDIMIRCKSLLPRVGLLAIPVLLVIPGDAAVLELYCRVAKLSGLGFALKFADGTILMPTNTSVRALKNKRIIIDYEDPKGPSSVLHFLGYN